MTTLLEIGVADGGTVLVEVDSPAAGPTLRGARSPETTIVEAGKSLDGVLAELGSMTQAMVARLRSFDDTPHEIEVEFSVKLTAEAKVVITRAAGEANFRIAMRWAPDLSTTG